MSFEEIIAEKCKADGLDYKIMSYPSMDFEGVLINDPSEPDCVATCSANGVELIDAIDLDGFADARYRCAIMSLKKALAKGR